MHNWFHIIPKNTGLSSYVWIIFCVLPFYFIFRSSGAMEIIFGIVMILLFFLSYRLSFIKNGWPVYIWVSVEMVISIVMTLFFGYVYFALFLAFFIGNIQRKGGFITLYIIHLTTTIAAILAGFLLHFDLFFSQLPFIIISLIGVILLPFNMYNRIKQEKLEGQLEDANKRISQLMVMEERQRIARDLHDTLGQKLSLIGLKSDLAGKLITSKPEAAKKEVNDIHQTARTALKEVREMVSGMRAANLQEEVSHIRQLLNAANMAFNIETSPDLGNIPLLVENVLSMSLKEAVTNVVKHSQATLCKVTIQQLPNGWHIIVEDNGRGMGHDITSFGGHGLKGMRERLEFVNGSLNVESTSGTTIHIHVPHPVQ
ncbi:sensor histidine kinase [Sediminibacillus halophilus]|uniref:histidine kinase n=1 Tax=Sediminibacillus halophilus TaxID=482461 RepID=A0A1G9P3X6_9BACI|nr:sensor histidine kinase [Sediminibacillus halophilus]SDL93400.1 two-component system, NarL family, sensor histidine kinase DesK [Sediminibacillus halophilus]